MNSNYINNEKKISETFSNNITSLQQNLSNLEDLKSEINIYLKEYQNHISNEINSNNSIEKSYIDYINGYSTHPIKINYFLKKFNLLKNQNNKRVNQITQNGKKFIELFKDINENPIKELHYLTQEIKGESKCINHICLLKDGRLISCGNSGELTLIKKSPTGIYEKVLCAEVHRKEISYVTQLKNGKIITCSNDNTMEILSVTDDDNINIEQILKSHESSVYKVIEIDDETLISISSDLTFKVWKKKFDNYICTNTIQFQKYRSYGNIMKINENEFVTISVGDCCLKFWDIKTLKLIKEIKNIKTSWGMENMCIIDDDILCIGGTDFEGYYLIQISNHQILTIIKGPEKINSIYKCLDGNIIFGIVDEDRNSSLIVCQFINGNLEKIEEKKACHNDGINSIIELNDGTIVSGSEDNLIKFWN
jgi:WD40 repeat protein